MGREAAGGGEEGGLHPVEGGDRGRSMGEGGGRR